MLGHWTREDEEEWISCTQGVDALYTAWVDLAVEAMLEEPPMLAMIPSGADAATWFRNHLERHRAAFLGSPTDPEVREAARKIGFSHIQSQVLPSWYISLYNLIFPAYHALEGQNHALALPALEVVRRRWLGDIDVTLDTYTVAMTVQITSLNELAHTDSLTGLLNRRGFWQRVSQDITRGIQKAAFVLIDLDRFKAVNDQGGHLEGDRVLQRMATLGNNLARLSDACGRLGGDEFAWWVVGLSDRNAVRRRFEDFSEALRREQNLTFSAGLAWYPDDGADVQALYHKADQALYRAKHSGRNRWAQAHQPEIHRL